MTLGDVGDLVTEDPGQLGLAPAGLDHPAGDEDVAAGSREGVGLGIVEDHEVVLDVGPVGVPGQGLAEGVQVGPEAVVREFPAEAGRDLERERSPDRPLLLVGDRGQTLDHGGGPADGVRDLGVAGDGLGHVAEEVAEAAPGRARRDGQEESADQHRGPTPVLAHVVLAHGGAPRDETRSSPRATAGAKPLTVDPRDVPWYLCTHVTQQVVLILPVQAGRRACPDRGPDREADPQGPEGPGRVLRHHPRGPAGGDRPPRPSRPRPRRSARSSSG